MPSAWTSVLSNLASRDEPERRLAAARRHRQGSGASARRDDGRARPVRRLQLEHRQAGPRRRAAAAGGGQDGQDHDRRPQGRRQPAPRPQPQHRRAHRLPRHQAAGLRARRERRRQAARHVRGRRIRRRDAVFLGVQVGHRAEADGAAAHSRQGCRDVRGEAAKARRQAVYEYEPGRGRRSSSYLLPPQHRQRRSSAACWRTPRPNRART